MTDKITATPTMARCVMCSAEIAQKDWGTHAKIHRAAPLMLEALEAIESAGIDVSGPTLVALNNLPLAVRQNIEAMREVARDAIAAARGEQVAV